MKLDEKDRAIITMYSKDPNIPQDAIAKEIGLSQPSVASRIRKLKGAGAIITHTGIDPLEMGLYLAKVDISSKNTSAILNMFRGCPYFANGFTVSGKNNLCLFFVSESIATLESIVDHHIRSHESVQDVDFNIIINADKKFIVPTELTPDTREKPPCGVMINCKDCPPFKKENCNGCPATGQYQGWLY